MATEDFTTYTEVDPNSKITVTATKLDINAITKGGNSYVYYDKGAGHFGDFEHLIEIYVVTAQANLEHCFCWGLSNSQYERDLISTNNDGIVLSILNYALDSPGLRIEDFIADNNDTTWVVTVGNSFYLTIERSTTTLTVKIYSDASRTTLEDTLSITCTTNTLRNIVPFGTKNGAGPQQLTIDIDNLDLQEAAPPPSGGSMQPIKCWGAV